jgi:hypothetical protein
VRRSFAVLHPADPIWQYFRHHSGHEPDAVAERHARRRTTAVIQACNIDGASMMTAATGGRPDAPKVSRKWRRWMRFRVAPAFLR